MIYLHTLGDTLIKVGDKEIRPTSPMLFAALLYLDSNGARIPVTGPLLPHSMANPMAVLTASLTVFSAAFRAFSTASWPTLSRREGSSRK